MNADGTQRLDRSLVAIAMGSQSDWATMQHASTQLDELSVAHECQIVSAHRTPEWMFEFAQTAEQRGFKVIIAGAGGTAHLPGMIASLTELPVFGVPIESRALKGMDSLLSIVQMPGGVPVGALAIGQAGARNAALLAARVLAIDSADIKLQLQQFKKRQMQRVMENPRPC